jgi:predicted thioesterase
MQTPVELGFLAQPLPPGTRIERTYPMTPDRLTSHIPNRAPVLMTPDLVALFEHTAAEMVRPRLADGATSVGTRVDIHHTGAAFGEDEVRVTANVTTVDGRKLWFEVTAHVGDRPVGHGTIGFTLVRF